MKESLRASLYITVTYSLIQIFVKQICHIVMLRSEEDEVGGTCGTNGEEEHV
jgi:hypothetical protein